MPMAGSTAILARASGRSTASCSISMPPSTGTGQVGAVRAVEQHREVVLLGDAAPWATMTRLTMWPLMSRPRMLVECLERLVGGLRDLDAAGLAAASGLDLRLYDTLRRRSSRQLPLLQGCPPRCRQARVPRTPRTYRAPDIQTGPRFSVLLRRSSFCTAGPHVLAVTGLRNKRTLRQAWKRATRRNAPLGTLVLRSDQPVPEYPLCE